MPKNQELKLQLFSKTKNKMPFPKELTKSAIFQLFIPTLDPVLPFSLFLEKIKVKPIFSMNKNVDLLPYSNEMV